VSTLFNPWWIDNTSLVLAFRDVDGSFGKTKGKRHARAQKRSAAGEKN